MGFANRRRAFVKGQVSPGYESLKDMFQYNVMTGKERNAQLCIYVKGEKVVDLWGSAEGDTTYTGDSIQCVMSSSKPITAIAMAMAADRGLIKYDEKVAKYWPQFGQNSKSHIKIEDVLRCEAGIAHMDTVISFVHQHPEELAAELARQRPTFHSHTPREYHTASGGIVCSQVFCRVSPGGVSLGSWIRDEIAKPLKVDVFLGLKHKDLCRVHNVTAPSETKALFHSLLPKSVSNLVEFNIVIFMKILSKKKKLLGTTFPDIKKLQDMNTVFNNIKWRQAEHPHGNMHASGRGLGKVAAAMAQGGSLDGVELLSSTGWNQLHGAPIVREDAYLKCRTELTQGGVNIYNDYPGDNVFERMLNSGRRGFVGWHGFGGSVMMWHPEHKIGFGYTCTSLSWWDFTNQKARKLQKEAVRCSKTMEAEC